MEQNELDVGKQNERGQELDEGSGHGRQNGRQANKTCRTGTQPAEQALQADSAGGLSIRHRPPHTRPQLTGRAARTTAADVILTLAVQVSGESAVVLAAMKAGADLPTPVPTPPIAFACHCPYPLP